MARDISKASHILTLRRRDPILGQKTPLLFAHRGGAGEVPESTEEAFRHAIEHGTDVLELDIRLTLDGEIVVWHGPGLEKVRGRNRSYTKQDTIGEFRWRDLRDKVWVLHPTDKPNFIATPKRRLLLLSDFFILVDKLQRELGSRRTLHLNIELKSPSGRNAPEWKNEYLDKLLDLVDAHSQHRTIILASVGHRRLKRLRRRMAARQRSHPTNLSWSEQCAFSKYMKHGLIRAALSLIGPFVREKSSPVSYALETSYSVLSKRLVHEVRKRGGSLYVFLTGFGPVPGIDHQSSADLKSQLVELLDTGVDGIMTDYPDKVGKLIRKCLRERGRE